MRKVVIVLGVLFIILGVIGVVLFTPIGTNTLVKPIINAQIQKRLPQAKIEITDLKHSPSTLRLKALIQESITFGAVGKLYYFKKAFDINYKIVAKELKVENDIYKLNLNIQGKMKGSSSNFAVYGEGEAFESNVTYKFRVQENLIKYITAQVQNAKIAQILLLAKQAPYLNGVLDLVINMPSLDLQNPKGVAKLQINDALFNRKLIFQDYQLLLPKNERLRANIQSKIANKKIFSYGDINTTTLKLKIKKLVSTLDFKVAKGYFDIKVDDLSRLNSLTKQKLKGSFSAEVVSYFNQKKDIFQALLTTKSLGGITKIKYNNQKISLFLKNLNIALIEKKLSLPYYVTKGNINATAIVKNLKNYETDFRVDSKLKINKKAVKFPLPSYQYTLSTQGAFKNLTLLANSLKIDSSYISLYSPKLQYSILTKRLYSKFNLKLLDLKALGRSFHIPLRGSVEFNGDVLLSGDKIKLNTQSTSLGGVVNIAYSNDSLSTQFKNISLKKLLYILKQPAIAKKGFATGKLSLDSIKNLHGKGFLKANILIDNKVIQKVYNINLGKSRALYLKLASLTLKNGRIYTDILLKTKGAIFNLYDLVYSLNSNNFKASYGLNIQDLSLFNTLAKQKLKGTLKVVGEVSKNGKYILLSGTSSKFDGTINFLLKGDKFTANAAGISILKVLDMLSKPQSFDGIAKVDLKYNIKTKLGSFTAIIDNGQFLNSSLVENLKKYANFDLSKELFSKVLIDGTINNNIIIFNVATKSQKVKITINKGKIDIANNTIYAKVRVHFNGNDYNFIVKGELDNPSYKLSYSGVVKKKVQKKLEQGIKKLGLDKELKKVIPKELENIDEIIPENTKKSAQELIKGLFK